MRNHADQEKTDQCRSDIDSSLIELEQLQKDYIQRLSSPISKPTRSQSQSPKRSTNNYINDDNRSVSADEQRRGRKATAKVSFQDDSIIEKFVMLFFKYLFVFFKRIN